jgi:putative membrane protein
MLREHVLFVVGLIVLSALVLSGVNPYDRVTWLLEIAPILIAAPVLLATYRRFPLTTLLYILIGMHALVLIFGGAYTYARVPFGFWLKEVFDLARNPYDKIGHFMQGAVPALIARELLLRGAYVSGKRMTAFLCVCVALAISACYELIEWWAALALGQGADEFLGTQGDPWDTQSDMFLALIGAVFSLAALARLHDRQMAAVEQVSAGPAAVEAPDV